MSYCHLLGGNLGNITMTLGPGPSLRRRRPGRVPTRMRDHVVALRRRQPGLPRPANGARPDLRRRLRIGEHLQLALRQRSGGFTFIGGGLQGDRRRFFVGPGNIQAGLVSQAA